MEEGVFGQQNAANSPIKGLERLSDDLRQERQKATIALQDRARLRVEVESLKGTIQQQLQELKESRLYAESTEQQRDQLQLELTDLLRDKQEMTIELHRLRDKANHSEADHLNNIRERDKYLEEMKACRAQLVAVQSLHSVLEAKLGVKEQQLAEYASEVDGLRKQISQFEEKEARSNALLLERINDMDEMTARVQQAEVMRESYQQHLLSTEDLKRELDKALANSSFLSQQLRDTATQLSQQQTQKQELELRLQRLVIERNSLANEKHELEQAMEELSARVRAEAEMASTEQNRAQSAVRANDILEQQLVELRNAHASLREMHANTEIQLAEARDNIALLQEELAQTQQREAEKDVALEEAQQASSLGTEVEFLRAQLGEVRKQLIRRGIEEEASVMTPKSLLDRENHSRQVYEGIILELRTDLDRAHSKCAEATRRWEESRGLAVKVAQLQEEVQMYRDSARAAAVESQSVAMSVSEAVERNIRNAHDKHLLLNEMKQLEATIQSREKDIQRQQEELALERQKHKATYLEKLAAERRVAELLVSKSRLETESDSLRQSSGSAALELERVRRQVADLTTALDDARRKAAQADTYHSELEAVRNAQQMVRSEAGRKEQQAAGELALLKQSKQLLQQEVATLKQSVEFQKKGMESSQAEIQRLKNEISELRIEKERQRKEYVHQENMRTDLHFQSLRQELEATVAEWQGAERDKSAKDENLWKMQKELDREKEKASLLKTQVGLLEERLRVAAQELGVYRSLDVYHSSVNSELLLLRANHSAGSKGGSEYPASSPSGKVMSDPQSASRFAAKSLDQPLTVSQMGTSTVQRRTISPENFDKYASGRPSHHAMGDSRGSLNMDDLSINSMEVRRNDNVDRSSQVQQNGASSAQDRQGRTVGGVDNHDKRRSASTFALDANAAENVHSHSRGRIGDTGNDDDHMSDRDIRTSRAIATPEFGANGMRGANIKAVNHMTADAYLESTPVISQPSETRRNSLLTMRDSSELRSQLHSQRRASSASLLTAAASTAAASTATARNAATPSVLSSTLNSATASSNDKMFSAPSRNGDVDTATMHIRRSNSFLFSGVDDNAQSTLADADNTSGRQQREQFRQQKIKGQLIQTKPFSSNNAEPTLKANAHTSQMNGTYEKADTPTTTTSSGYKPLKADFDKARRLLAKSGFT